MILGTVFNFTFLSYKLELIIAQGEINKTAHIQLFLTYKNGDSIGFN